MQTRIMTLTLNVPDELAAYMPKNETDLVAVLTAGLQRWRGRQRGEVQQMSDVTELLAGLPSAQEVMALRPSAEAAERAEALLRKNSEQGLTVEEQAEWEDIKRVEHLVRVAKAKAALKLKST
jgi:hypothetical protein